MRPRGETSRFDLRSRDVREAGRSLGVDVVVDGSVRRIGDALRVSVRLVTVEDGFQLWARRFDRAPAAVLSVADEAASAIARALATVRTAPARPAPADARAQDLYLRGRYLLHCGWFEVSLEGVKLLREAHERAPDDPRIAGTYALAVARILTANADSFEVANEARELAERTLEMDPTQCEARVALGFLHLNNGEGAAAAVQLKRALAISPTSVEALDGIGRVLVEAGRAERGIATLRRALVIEPGMALAKQAIVRAYVLLGDLESAREALGPLPTQAGDLSQYLFTTARFAMWRGDVDAADSVVRDIELRPDISPQTRSRILGLVEVTKTRKVSPALAPGLQDGLALDKRFTPRRVSFHAQLRAELKLCCNDLDGALDDLHVADLNGLLDLLWLDRCPLMDLLRGRPEMIKIRESTANRADRVIRVLDP